MDTHIATLEFAVVNERGDIRVRERIPTSTKGLIEFLKEVPKPRTLYIEEGSLAAWVVDTCHRFGEKVVVTDPKRNKWIGKSEDKDDPIDALKLAELARGKYIKEIHHAVGDRRRFRELILYYHDSVKNQTRIKNKIKSKFRQNGIDCKGQTVYLKKYQSEWIRKLPENPIVFLMVKQLLAQLEKIEQGIQETVKTIKKQSQKYPEIKVFRKIPGIGHIHSATISAILETPHRFATKKKVWKYAGFGLVKKQSSTKTYSEKLTQNHNRLLKFTIKQAVQAAIKSKDNQFRRHYLHYVLEKKVSEKKACVNVARSLLATLWAIWRKGEAYTPKRISLKSNIS